MTLTKKTWHELDIETFGKNGKDWEDLFKKEYTPTQEIREAREKIKAILLNFKVYIPEAKEILEILRIEGDEHG